MKKSRSSESLKWSRILYVPVLWLAFGATAGALFAWVMNLSAYGFRIGVFIGVCVGLAGITSHCVLFLLPRFRRASEPLQTLLLWVCTVGVLAVLQLADSVFAGSTPSWDALAFMSVPVLVAAIAFNRIVRRAKVPG